MIGNRSGSDGRYRLYGDFQTGTCAIQAALSEIGIDYEFVEIPLKDKQQLTEDYRRINPRQQVPALVLADGTIVTEGPAILMHLADAHPEAGLAPPPGSSQRAWINRWLLFFCVNVYEGELRKLKPQDYIDATEGAEPVQSAAVEYVKRHYLIFEDIIEPAPYLLGEQLSILDIYVWMLAQWMDGQWLARHCPKIRDLAEQVRHRERIAPVHLINFG